MGRSGGGGSHGGGMSHSSHSSSSHSHSSHSSSRSSGSSFRSSGSSWRPSNSGYRRTSYTHIGPTYVGGGTRRTYGRSRSSGNGIIVITVIVLILMVMIYVGFSHGSGGSGIQKSTVNRERLNADSFTSDCVVDNIGWVTEEGSSPSRLGGQLQEFWDETGIQPYIALFPYSSDTDTADERFDAADAWYKENIGREDAMLLAYFDDEPDGNWEMVAGTLTGTVLDPEAKEIFWSVLDRYWNDVDHYSIPQALAAAFENAGNHIMTKSTTGLDIVKIVVIITGGVLILVGILIVMKTRRAHQAAQAAETERILNTPLSGSNADSDPLVDRYRSNDP